jgi:hypothetical protein
MSRCNRLSPEAYVLRMSDISDQLLQIQMRSRISSHQFPAEVLKESRRIQNMFSSSRAPVGLTRRDKLDTIWRHEVEGFIIRDSMYASRDDDVSLHDYSAFLLAQ